MSELSLLSQLKYDADGLIPAIIQDAENGEVLMMGWMDREAVQRTLSGEKVCFWSRSRKKYWVKGETSGHYQLVKGVYVDCDMDVLLIKVSQVGAACHAGYRSCFFREVTPGGLAVIAEQIVDPDEVYKK